MPTTDTLIEEAAKEFDEYNANSGGLLYPNRNSEWLRQKLTTIATKSAERIREVADMVWVCHECAELFGRKFTDKTNIYTQVFRECECCGEGADCMHINSYETQPKDITT